MTTLRRVATSRGGAGFPHSEQGLDSGDLPFIKVSDFNHRGNERTVTHCSNWVSRVTARRLGASVVPSGALLMPKVGAAMLGNARRLTSQPSVFDNNVLAVVPNGIESRYLHYWLRTIDAAAFAKPGPIPSMGDDALLDLVVPVEALAEQRAIADYLDAETARIDALIAKKQQLIHLLKERLETAMAELACGRRHGEPLTESGFDWIGRIPEGWQVSRLNKVARLESGHTPSRSREDLWLNADKPWITLNDVGTLAGSEFISETKNLISDAGLAASSARMLPAHTVVLSRDATIGRVGIMATSMATSQHFAAWVCSGALRPRFLWLLLRFPMQQFLASFDDGATLRTIGMPHVRRFVVPLPPIQEQDRLVEIAERRRAAMMAVGDCLASQIKLFAEQRQTLISAAVSGEFAVPGAA